MKARAFVYMQSRCANEELKCRKEEDMIQQKLTWNEGQDAVDKKSDGVHVLITIKGWDEHDRHLCTVYAIED